MFSKVISRKKAERAEEGNSCKRKINRRLPVILPATTWMVTRCSSCLVHPQQPRTSRILRCSRCPNNAITIPRFLPAYFVSQLDNTLLNQTYQIFTGGGIFFNPGLNGFFKLGIRDLLEDYRITGGFRLSGDLNSNEYYMSYENLKKRLDKTIQCSTEVRSCILNSAVSFTPTKHG